MKTSVTGSQGGVFDPSFLLQIQPLYDMHMGVENMGPLLYMLVRFLKPLHVLEVGAGYTTIFIMQALRDNHEEMLQYEAMHKKQQAHINGTPWCVEPYLKREAKHKGMLHTVDNMAHAHTTADKVIKIGESLGLSSYLTLHEADAYTFAKDKLQHMDLQLDFLWIDLGAANRIKQVMEDLFPYISAGGMLAVHSTLTNMLSRTWLEEMRAHQRVDFELFSHEDSDEVQKERMRSRKWFDQHGKFASLSFLEPHKIFQNSCTLFQKRGNFTDASFNEPVYTQYP